MRGYYYGYARWIQGLMLGVVLAGAVSHVVVASYIAEPLG